MNAFVNDIFDAIRHSCESRNPSLVVSICHLERRPKAGAEGSLHTFPPSPFRLRMGKRNLRTDYAASDLTLPTSNLQLTPTHSNRVPPTPSSAFCSAFWA